VLYYIKTSPNIHSNEGSVSIFISSRFTVMKQRRDKVYSQTPEHGTYLLGIH